MSENKLLRTLFNLVAGIVPKSIIRKSLQIQLVKSLVKIHQAVNFCINVRNFLLMGGFLQNLQPVYGLGRYAESASSLHAGGS